MTSLPGNPHESCVVDLVDQLNTWLEMEGETDATMLGVALSANTQATMALAYEQRTANMIALLGEMRGSNLCVTWVKTMVADAICRTRVDEVES